MCVCVCVCVVRWYGVLAVQTQTVPDILNRDLCFCIRVAPLSYIAMLGSIVGASFLFGPGIGSGLAQFSLNTPSAC